jgi:predicted metal-binding membrane protein
MRKSPIEEKKINVLLRDLLVGLGSGLVVTGCCLAWLPLGLVVGGVALGFLGIAGQMEVERRRREDERNHRLGI